MQLRHVPKIDARYWAGITLAFMASTNLGDLYAHRSGLGLIGGLPILAGIFLFIYAVENFDKSTHDAYYWICVLTMCIGATNIADYLSSRHIHPIALCAALAGLLAVFAWAAFKLTGQKTRGAKELPETNWPYWLALLSAGVFGTALGDFIEDSVGGGAASLGLALILVATLIFNRGRGVKLVAAYWFIIAVARATGTAVGDWLAANLGLLLAPLVTTLTFAAVILLWRSRLMEREPPETGQPS